MKINSLLNPVCVEQPECQSSASPRPLSPRPLVPLAARPLPSPRRQKVPKDAPIFSEGNKIHGIINYPAHENTQDPVLLAQHSRFQVYPLGEIATKGIRQIPYNSDKKDFLEKTGRDAFQMYQYTYKLPGQEKEFTVVWDYNVGLVRMTPFFKSLKYSKTVPAKALRENPGLKEVSYSITGGALVCQGYWFPYQAAKAIAATFCWDIRFALTPVFGFDFPFMCVRPEDTDFAKFYINPSIVQYCISETDRFREEGASYRLPVLNPAPKLEAAPKPKLESPRMRFDRPQWQSRARRHHRIPAMLDTESGYGSDDGVMKAAFTPEISPRSAWRPMTGSQVPPTPYTSFTASMSPPMTPARPFTMSPPDTPAQRPFIRLPTPASNLGYDNTSFRTKRTHSKVSLHGDHEDDIITSRPQTSYVVGHQLFAEPHATDTFERRSGLALPHNHQGPLEPPVVLRHTQEDIDVANVLMNLSRKDCKLLLPPPTKRTRRGSTL